MRLHVTVKNKPEKEKYHTYWRLHIPMLLAIMGELGLHHKIHRPTIYLLLAKMKKNYKICFSYILATWIYK